MKTFGLITFITCMILAINAGAQNDEIGKAKERIKILLEDDSNLWEPDKKTNSYPYYSWRIKRVMVSDDKIELIVNDYIEKGKNKKAIYTENEFQKTIKFSTSFTYNGNCIYVGNYFHIVKKITDEDLDVKELYKCITLLRDNYFNAELQRFNQTAIEYRAQVEKPAVSEEQREYIVQANVLNSDKQYKKAIEYYNKAIDVNITSYPAAYYNLALLSAQINDYGTAILCMKKYLMLVPDAEDARAAQDKIYEWKIKL